MKTVIPLKEFIEFSDKEQLFSKSALQWSHGSGKESWFNRNLIRRKEKRLVSKSIHHLQFLFLNTYRRMLFRFKCFLLLACDKFCCFLMFSFLRNILI